jgi:hypothetical protein
VAEEPLGGNRERLSDNTVSMTRPCRSTARCRYIQPQTTLAPGFVDGPAVTAAMAAAAGRVDEQG